jgi:hypothetical protein
LNWDAIGAVGEITGAVAVVITLIYLALQIKTSSTLTKATIREQRTAGSNAVTAEWIRQADVFVRVANGEELDSVDSFRIALSHQAMFREWETWAYQHHIGVLDDSEWNAILVNFRTLLGFPGTADYWSQSKGMYSTLLVTVIDELLKLPGGDEPPILWNG